MQFFIASADTFCNLLVDVVYKKGQIFFGSYPSPLEAEIDFHQ